MKRIFFTMLITVFLGFYSLAQEPEMVLVEGGEFMMGNNDSKEKDEKPEHKVTVSSYYMSIYEVTYESYDLFCESRGLEKPDDGGFGRGKLPVMNVSWDDAIMYCNYLSKKYKYDQVYSVKNDSMGLAITADFTKNGFRLPTEAEWEYAARGGAKTENYGFFGSENPKETTWYKENSEEKPHEVGKLKPNELGIYDMSGNVWEWCWDVYDKDIYGKGTVTDPRGAEKGANKVYRGANFTSVKDFIILSRRFSLPQSYESGMIGIRLVRNGK